MEKRVIVTTPPSLCPVTIVEARNHCRVDNDDETELLNRLIKTATEQVENDTRRALITQSLRLYLDAFPCGSCIDLPRPPLVSVSSIQYVDSNGTNQTWDSSNYIVDTASEPGRVTLAYGKSWPTARCQTNAIQINYSAGWTRSTIPAAAKQLVLLWVAHFYENKGDAPLTPGSDSMPMAIQSLTWRLRTGEYA